MNSESDNNHQTPAGHSDATPPTSADQSGPTPEAASALVLWCRHSSGDTLSPAEARELHTQWQTNPTLRQQIADELWIDQLLRLQAESPAQTEAFIAQVRQKCEASRTTNDPPQRPTLTPSPLPASDHKHSPAQSPRDLLLGPPDSSEPAQLRAPVIAIATPHRTTKSPAAARRWAWWVAAALLAGVSAVGISYQWSLPDRANQSNADRTVPANPAQEQPGHTRPNSLPKVPSDGELPNLDPNIQAHLKPADIPDNPPVERSIDPKQNDINHPSAIANSALPLTAPENQSQPTSSGSLDRNTSTEAPTERNRILATITRVEPADGSAQPDPNPTWELGQRLGANEVLPVTSGDLQLTLANGVIVDVFAPSRVELVSPNTLRLWQGEIATQVPPPAVGFQVLTPAATVTDLGTTFDVLVDPLGTTEIEVRSGQVSVATSEQTTQQQWLLTAEDAYNLTLYLPTPSADPNNSLLDDDRLPDITDALASRLRQVSGRITGVVSLDGRSLQFDDETVFVTVKERLFRGLANSETSLLDTWSQFVEASTAGPQPQGQLRLNDQEFNFGNFNEAVKAQHEVLAQFAPERLGPLAPQRPVQPPVGEQTPRLGPLTGLENFRGSLMMHGKRRDFSSWEEYKAAMKELMGPLAEFGGFPFLP